MHSQETIVLNKTGLHARPAASFVSAAARFKSTIQVQHKGSMQQANAKSIVLLLSLAITQGTSILITAEGEDEAEAVDTLIGLVQDGFGEL